MDNKKHTPDIKPITLFLQLALPFILYLGLQRGIDWLSIGALILYLLATIAVLFIA